MAVNQIRDIEKVAKQAADAAHTVMGPLIDAAELSERNKINAATLAVNALFAGLLDSALEWDNPTNDDLILALFNYHCSSTLTQIALRAKRRNAA